MGEQDFVFEGEQGQPSGEQPGSSSENGRTASLPTTQTVPYHRFSEVNGKLKSLEAEMAEYKKYGDPKSLAEMKARYEEMSKGKRFTNSELSQIRNDMFTAFPELKQYEEDRKTRFENFVSTGEQRADKWMKDLGYHNAGDDDAAKAHNTKIHRLLQGVVAEFIAADESLVRRFKVGDSAVYDEAFGEVKKLLGLGNLKRQLDAQVLKTKKAGAQPVNGGAIPKPTGDGKPKSDRDILDDAHEEAFAMLEAAGGE